VRSVLLDTNLLVLLVVGVYDKALIREHKRTKNFVPEDFDLLERELCGFEVIWITSHCLAEASNLLKQTDSSRVSGLLECLGQITKNAKESHIHKRAVFGNNNAFRLGVADAGIIIKSKRVTCVLTVDFDLYAQISNIGRKVVNFNHLRAETLLA
jgi:hypothetical protein